MTEIKTFIAIIALIFVGGRYCFSQSNETGQIMKSNSKQEELIAALEKRIAEDSDEFISLTAEEYELLLSQPIGIIEGFEPHTTAAGGILVGYGFPDGPKIYKTDIQTIFPNIPNIGEGEVFVIFDYVKGTNGLDYLDHHGNTEIKEDSSYAEDDFTQLTLDIRTVGSKSYCFGSRYVNLRDPGDDMTVRALGALGGEVELSVVSGKVVMQLPTNITGILLAKEDIGVEKSFGGGIITLKEIKDDQIVFQFSDNSDKIYSWTVYNDSKSILDIDKVLSNDGLFQLYAEHPMSVKVFQAEIVRKEFPFSFEIEKRSDSQ